MKKNKTGKKSFLAQSLLSAVVLFVIGTITLSLYPGKPELGMKFNEFMTADVLRPTISVKGRTTKIRKPNPSVRMTAMKFAQADAMRESAPDVSCEVAKTAPNKDGTIPELTYDVAALNTEITLNVAPGEIFPLILKLKNIGTTPWFSESSNCASRPKIHLGTSAPRDHENRFAAKFDSISSGWMGNNRIEMREPRVGNNEVGTFVFWNIAPSEKGIYREYLQTVIEGVKWIENPKIKITIYVGEFSPEETADLERYLLPGSSSTTAGIDFDADCHIDIDLSEQKMRVYIGDALIREYGVSSGKAKTPTPVGSFKILNKQTLRVGSEWPHYRMPFWQMFTKWGHGLHALPYLANDGGSFWKEARNHIGIPVSHGCVRVWDENAEELYGFTKVGDKVVAHY